MFTSLNVVRMAAVDCDWTRRSATRWRRRDMGTRVSARAPVGGGLPSRRRPGSKAWAPAFAGVTPNTSALVTRPSRPEPCTAEVSMPFSAAILAAEGEAAGAAGALPAAAGASGWAPTFVGATAACAGAAVAFPSVSITAITSPLVTESPSFLMIFASTPSEGAGSSRTTLSVSTSIRFSSRATASPAFLRQATRVASEIDSESCGTLTSTCMDLSFFLSCLAPRASRLGRFLLRCRIRRERGFHELLLLLGMELLVAHGRGGRRLAARVVQLLVRAHVAHQVVLDAVPRALVAGLLLAPDHGLRVRVELDLGLELVVRERVELLEAHDRDVVDAALRALGGEVVV